jgi:paraquat-inducible protein B
MIRPGDEIPAVVPTHPAAPRPIIKKARWPFPMIWVVPILAGVLALYYFYDHLQERGPVVAVTFSDVGGLMPDQTPVAVHGVPIGRVASLSLDEHHQAVANIQLKREFASVARSGTRFWIVRPEVSQESVSGLGTLVSGPYIEVLPADGEETKKFAGMDHPPHDVGVGLTVFLFTAKLEHLQPGSAVIYRGIHVGHVQDADLSDDSSAVRVRALIAPRYAKLVRANSKFWSSSGAEFNAGVLTGVHVRVPSLSGLISGSVTFATPDDIGQAAKEGQVFDIYDEPKKEWLAWSPAIMLPGEDASTNGRE